MTHTHFAVRLRTLCLVPRAEQYVRCIVQAPNSLVAVERARALFLRAHPRYRVVQASSCPLEGHGSLAT